MKFGFGSRIKPRKFDYLPRFYDEAKEQLNQRVAAFKGDVTDEEKVKQRISVGLRKKYHGDPTFRSQQTKQSNLRLLYIIIILCLITYLVLTSDKIRLLIETFDS